MTQEETRLGNKAIAEFMGWKYISDGDCFYKAPNYLFSNEMKYHSSWEWLMPVVEKISRIKLDEYENNADTHYMRTFGMISDEGKFMARINCFGLHMADTLIVATWSAVVEFIDHCNQSQP